MSMIRWMRYTVFGGAVLWCIVIVHDSWRTLPLTQLTEGLKANTQSINYESLQLQYQLAVERGPIISCHTQQLKSLLQLALLGSEFASAQGSFEQADEWLSRALQINQKQLQCRPFHGKHWLDRTLLLMQHEGFTPSAQSALYLSYYTTPNEAWLAELRLRLAYDMIHFLTPELRQQARRDVTTIKNALARRRMRVLDYTNTPSADALSVLFGNVEQK